MGQGWGQAGKGKGVAGRVGKGRVSTWVSLKGGGGKLHKGMG